MREQLAQTLKVDRWLLLLILYAQVAKGLETSLSCVCVVQKGPEIRTGKMVNDADVCLLLLQRR